MSVRNSPAPRCLPPCSVLSGAPPGRKECPILAGSWQEHVPCSDAACDEGQLPFCHLDAQLPEPPASGLPGRGRHAFLRTLGREFEQTEGAIDAWGPKAGATN